MGRKLAGLLLLSAVFLLLPVAGQTTQPDAAMQSFWDQFKAAVIAGNKQKVAGWATFPIDMPYGVRSVSSRAQLIKRYREVFNGEANAARCFADATPQKEAARPKEFTVGCKNSAGDEVIIYRFVLTKAGWRFKGLDNINE